MKTLNKFKGKSSFFGFTLIELIVVIAIIGVLISILVPTMMGYIGKARRQVDRSSASNIGKTVIAIAVLGEPEMKTTFYSSTDSYSVTANVANNSESYTVNVVCRSNHGEWVTAIDSIKPFAEALNFSYSETTQGSLDLKYKNNADCWAVCFRPDVKDSVEVWASKSTGDKTCEPMYRVWPDPAEEYT